MSKITVRKCLHCRERAVSTTILPSYAIETEHDGRKYSFSVPNLKVLQCQNCKAIVLDESANETIEGALREAIGLLSPSEIRRKREALGLNQQQLADYLRISMYTLSRWETGAADSAKGDGCVATRLFSIGRGEGHPGCPISGASVAQRFLCYNYHWSHRVERHRPFSVQPKSWWIYLHGIVGVRSDH